MSHARDAARVLRKDKPAQRVPTEALGPFRMQGGLRRPESLNLGRQPATQGDHVVLLKAVDWVFHQMRRDHIGACVLPQWTPSGSAETLA